MQERTCWRIRSSGIGKVERELEDEVGMIELGEAENDARRRRRGRKPRSRT